MKLRCWVIVIIHHIKVGVVHDKYNLILGKFAHFLIDPFRRTDALNEAHNVHTVVKSYLPVDSSIHNPHLVTVVQRWWAVLRYCYIVTVPRSTDVGGISFWTNRFW